MKDPITDYGFDQMEIEKIEFRIDGFKRNTSCHGIEGMESWTLIVLRFDLS